MGVDILSRRRGGRFTLTEVKSTTKVKPEHLPDAAVQAYVLRRAGLDVDRVELMHLDRECAFPDLSNLFRRVDVTDEVEPFVKTVPREAKRQLAMLQGPLPDVEPGDHCTAPYECPFLARCWPPLPEHHVSTLNAVRSTRVAALVAEGYETLFDLPDDAELNEVQHRQWRAVRAGKLVVELGLGGALAALEAPIAYLDFETVAPAIPAWDGCHPYDAVPVQWSVHLDKGDGAVKAHAWIASGPDDPRPACAAALAKALKGAKTVAAYNAPFEKRCLQMLADAAPEHRDVLLGAVDRAVDLLPLVRQHVYHPDFGGSFSLKSVLPALVPDLGYDDLEVGEGGTASTELERLMFDDDMTDAARAKLRKALLAYCGRDTEALVRLVERLRELAARWRPARP